MTLQSPRDVIGCLEPSFCVLKVWYGAQFLCLKMWYPDNKNDGSGIGATIGLVEFDC